MVDISITELPARADHHDFNTPIRRKMRKMLDKVGWTVVLLLLFVGLSSLVSRVVLLNSEFSREVVNIGNGVNNFDIRYIQHYFVAGVHLLFGLIVYVFVPFQFMTSIRKRFIGFHRWSGRAWMISGAAAGFTGAFFGVVWPFTGHQGFGLLQTGINAIIGPYTLFCLYKAYSNIRARNFGEHREWMIRTFALMLGVATQRVLMIILTVFTGIGREPMFAPAMIAGMIINIVVSEYWIAWTKTPCSGHRHWKDLDRRMAP
ncbi:MAG: DUF2306 domain-containing protein [Pseudomonadales bacterium]|nr:DUF2306 domain-containing protein [Pseudomonadales bacterium]